MPAKRKSQGQITGDRVTRNSPKGQLSKAQSPVARSVREQTRNSTDKNKTQQINNPGKKPIQPVVAGKSAHTNTPEKKSTVKSSEQKSKVQSSNKTNKKSQDENKNLPDSETNHDSEKGKANGKNSTELENNNEMSNASTQKVNKTRKRRNSDSGSQQQNKVAKINDKEDIAKELASPRRSSRGVVPNRKYHDMEIEHTPTRRKDKTDEGTKAPTTTAPATDRKSIKKNKDAGKKGTVPAKSGKSVKDAASVKLERSSHNEPNSEENLVNDKDGGNKDDITPAPALPLDDVQESLSDQLVISRSTDEQISGAASTEMETDLLDQSDNAMEIVLDPQTGELKIDGEEPISKHASGLDISKKSTSGDREAEEIIMPNSDPVQTSRTAVEGAQHVLLLSSPDADISISQGAQHTESDINMSKQNGDSGVQDKSQSSQQSSQVEDFFIPSLPSPLPSNQANLTADDSVSPGDQANLTAGDSVSPGDQANLTAVDSVSPGDQANLTAVESVLSGDQSNVTTDEGAQILHLPTTSSKTVTSKKVINYLPHRPGILKAYKVKTIDLPTENLVTNEAKGQVDISSEGETSIGGVETMETSDHDSFLGDVPDTAKVEIIELSSSVKKQFSNVMSIPRTSAGSISSTSADNNSFLPSLVTPDGSTVTVRKSGNEAILTLHSPSSSSNKTKRPVMAITTPVSSVSKSLAESESVNTDPIVMTTVIKEEEQAVSSISTQTPIASNTTKKLSSRHSHKGLQSSGKTITFDIQQQEEIMEEEEENDENEKSQNSQEFVIVHLPEGQSVKRRYIKPEKEETIPFSVESDGTFVCGICSYKTNKKTNWYKHKKKHHGCRNHKCPYCTYTAATSSNLKRHINIHKDVRDYHCAICGQTFRQKIHLERHIKYKHEEKQVKCPLCDYMCANENPDLKIHIKRRHIPQDMSDGNIRAFTCDECGLITVSKKDLRQHMKFHKSGPELKLFCQLCSFVTDCESRLRRHMLSHTNERPFQCGLCDYRGSQKEHVLRHMRSQHHIEIERKHKKNDEENSDESDSRDGYEKKSERSDYTSQEKIFACNHCSMKFAKLINLYKHLHAQHKDILPDESNDEFLCVVCEFKTTSKKNLLVHMRKHNIQDQVPPSHVYSCVLCRYMNPKRRNLFQHMKKKHGIEIVMKDDGSTSCFVADNVSVSDESVQNILTVGDIVTATTEEPQLQIVTDESDIKKDRASSNMQNVISIEELAYAVSHPLPNTSGSVVVVERSETQSKPTIVHDAAEAIEGLQALAEQPGILQEVVADDNFQIIEEIKTSKPTDESSMETEVITMETTAVLEDLSDKQAEKESNIQLSQEQLMSLSTGDFVEINGEMYKVEISTEENQDGVTTVSHEAVLQSEMSA